VVRLEALANDDSETLIDGLLGGAAVPATLRRRIVDAAEGNPLFVEQFVAMLDEERIFAGAAGVDLTDLPVPPTIQALLAARLDRLDGRDRPVLSRASVIGRVFWQGALVELSPPDARAEVPLAVRALIERQLLLSDTSEFADDAAFRFRHLLVRDSAYDSLPKADRAELHEAFARWLEVRAGDRLPEFEEILGHHYETAAGYVRELGLGRARRLVLESQAAARLRSAGERAYRRGDMTATRSLLERTRELLPLGDPSVLPVLPLLGKAYMETGDLDAAVRSFETAIEQATTSGDRRTELQARAHRLLIRTWQEPDIDGPALESEADQLRRAAEEHGDLATEALAWTTVCEAIWIQGRNRDAEPAARRVVELARAAGDDRTALEYLALIASGSSWSWPVGQTIEICEAALADGGGSPIVGARALPTLGVALAAAGDVDRGRALVAEGIGLCRELGLRFWEAEMAGQASDIEEYAGDLSAAQSWAEVGWRFFDGVGDRSHAAYFASAAARLAALRGDDPEAASWLDVARSAAPDERHGAGLTAIVAEATLLRRRGDLAAAEALARRAVAMLTLGWTGQGAAVPEIRMLLASLLRRRGAKAEAEAELAAARDAALEWGMLPWVGRIDAAIADRDWPHDPDLAPVDRSS
jgi:tetratricopeptide (TPR) repeat protein